MSNQVSAALRVIARIVGALCAMKIVWFFVALGAAYLGAATEPAPTIPLTSADLPARLANASPTKELPHGRWRFAVLGDPEDNRPVFRALLERARALDCAFVLLTGDLVKHESALSFRMVLADLATHGFRERVATVRGNHDPAWLYRGFFGSSEWTFDLDGIRFVGLDNATNKIKDEALETATRMLRAPRAGPLLLAIHKPIFPYQEPVDDDEADDDDDDDDETTDARTPLERFAAGERRKEWRLRNVCVETRVDYVLASHLHAYERETFSGVQQVISGAGGGPPQGNFDGWHMLVVEVDAGKIDVRRENVPDPPFDLVAVIERAGLEYDNDLIQEPKRTSLWFAIPMLGMGLLFVRRRSEGGSPP